MNKVWRGRLVRYTPFILWTGVVMGFSTSGASMNRTSRFIRPLLEFLFPDAPEQTLFLYHGIIRKSAHFIEYAILAALAYRAFRESSKILLASHPFLAALLSVAIVAVVDETYQSFDPSRTGSPIDVLIDLSGALAALAAARFFVRKRKIDKSDNHPV
ncbi:MAG: VanZ family protein [Acidobacteriota bacterium]|nr:MAG: VanZ family protein [Acidobacteriota bacterium]